MSIYNFIFLSLVKKFLTSSLISISDPPIFPIYLEVDETFDILLPSPPRFFSFRFNKHPI